MSEMLDAAAAASRLLAADDILLICHKNPDGDTLGSAAALFHALKALGKTVAVICADPMPERYAYMCMEEYTGQFEVRYTVAIDVAGIQLFGDAVQQYTRNIDLCIDHHASNSQYADGVLLDADAAATAEIMYALLCTMGTVITPLIADCLYTGVATDTGCFIFGNTTAHTHMVACKLMQLGANTRMLNTLLFESKSRSRMEIERIALASLSYYLEDRCAIICLTKEQIEATGVEMNELESISGMPRKIEGVQVGVTLRQLPSGSFKVSIRTQDGIDAAAIARRLGGGGHAGAAGCEILGSLENARAAVLAEIERELKIVHVKPQSKE